MEFLVGCLAAAAMPDSGRCSTGDENPPDGQRYNRENNPTLSTVRYVLSSFPRDTHTHRERKKEGEGTTYTHTGRLGRIYSLQGFACYVPLLCVCV